MSIETLTIFTTQAHGKWVAATARTPFFCFEAATEKEALALASAALRFYIAGISEKQAPSDKFERFQTKNRVLASELVAA